VGRVRVSIDKLVLNGFDSADREAVVGGLQGELARVLSDPAAHAEWARSRRTPVLHLGSLPWEPGPRGGRKLGDGIARAIGKELKP
jgi:hypothetical protein